MNQLLTHARHSGHEPARPDLLALADLKWLMSAYVVRIDIERLLRDPLYARRCWAEAMATPSQEVHRQADRALAALI